MQEEGSISFSDIVAEFGGEGAIILSDYYGVADGIPGEGEIKMSDFYGTSAGGGEPGQEEFTVAGEYIWTCPAGVSSISVLCIGGGGGGLIGGDSGRRDGGNSSFNNFIIAEGGQSADPNTQPTNGGLGGGPSGTFTAGFTGGTGANTSGGNAGGGGCAGYGGNGGDGSSQQACAKHGGGTGIYGGSGAGGTGGSNVAGTPSSGGIEELFGGGAGQCDGGTRGGGGGGGLAYITSIEVSAGVEYPVVVGSAGSGGDSFAGVGAVRIIWGDGRFYPNTNTANV